MLASKFLNSRAMKKRYFPSLFDIKTLTLNFKHLKLIIIFNNNNNI